MSTDCKPVCRLFRLPAELRNRIYELALVQKKHIHASIAGCEESWSRPNSKQVKRAILALTLRQPPLTRTCRKLREEALPIFYGGNVFHVPILHNDGNAGEVIDWLTAVGAKNRSLLHQLYLPAIVRLDVSYTRLFEAFGDSVSVTYTETKRRGTKRLKRYNRVLFSRPEEG